MDMASCHCCQVNLLVHEVEVVLQGLRADGTFAHLQIDAREVVDVIDAHFIRNGEAAHCDVVSLAAVVPARRHQSIPLCDNHLQSLPYYFLTFVNM